MAFPTKQLHISDILARPAGRRVEPSPGPHAEDPVAGHLAARRFGRPRGPPAFLVPGLSPLFWRREGSPTKIDRSKLVPLFQPLYRRTYSSDQFSGKIYEVFGRFLPIHSGSESFFFLFLEPPDVAIVSMEASGKLQPLKGEIQTAVWLQGRIWRTHSSLFFGPGGVPVSHEWLLP